MFETFRNAFKTPDLRKKLLFTFFIIVIFRVGAAIPVPFLDPSAIKELMGQSGNLLGYIDVLTGGALSQATLFAMSITPYINSSIIIQLLTVAIPPLERLAKEGEEGRKKITKITRYVTVVLALVQALGYYFLLKSKGAVQFTNGFQGVFVAVVIIATFTAGAALLMWLGEQINEKGIGNGISMILFAGIISRGPAAFGTLWEMFKQGMAGQTKYFIIVPAIVVVFIAMIVFIVFVSNAERRIPVQYAKRVVGRKQYGGQSSHIPIKVNTSGVMPIIFASSILAVPGTIGAFFNPSAGTFWYNFISVFKYDHWFYAVLYFILIIAFNYFYVAIQYNPIEIANNLRKNNGAIPGIRPGKPTSDFIVKILSKITFIGAIFLAIVAICPIIFNKFTGGANIALGGTSMLIVVGVALETMRSLESQMMMRHHKGFLE